ncbi:MAG: ABC transporter substrate-binding protein, partial [Thermodesulfobacteriota bacterium]|nr:ABC transporter substrate-binding protein [Thermodesulfobacteriota bacterium]
MRMRAVCMLIVGFFLILGFSNAVSAVDKVDAVVPKDTIKIGVIADMTGPTATLQVPAPKAMRVFFRHINDQGGILGRKVQLIIEDDRYTIPLHVSAFKKLVYRDKAFMFVELGGTGQGLALVPQFTKLKIPNFMAVTSRSFVRPTLPYHFTNGATYEDEIE